MRIVAIGGGNNSDIKKNGKPQIYEQEAIDREIINISNKSNPNVLFVSHASGMGYEYPSFDKINNTYGKMYNCPVKLLKRDHLYDKRTTSELINWADIIYVGAGNTNEMMEYWKYYDFDKVFSKDVIDEKVLCGISAGANCWFRYSISDYLQVEKCNPNAPFMPVEGLNMVSLVFSPHASYSGRFEGMRDILKTLPYNGLSLTDNMAIEIIDGNYKLIKGFSSEGKEIYAQLSYWNNDEYHTELLEEKGLVKRLKIKNNS